MSPSLKASWMDGKSYRLEEAQGYITCVHSIHA